MHDQRLLDLAPARAFNLQLFIVQPFMVRLLKLFILRFQRFAPNRARSSRSNLGLLLARLLPQELLLLRRT